MRTYEKIQLVDTIHSNWYGDGTVLDLDETGAGKIKFGRFFVCSVSLRFYAGAGCCRYSDGDQHSIDCKNAARP